jgi:hypothetical protein
MLSLGQCGRVEGEPALAELPRFTGRPADGREVASLALTLDQQ